MKSDCRWRSRGLALVFAAACAAAVGCAPRANMSVLIQMIKDQEEYFRREVIPVFEKKNRFRITAIPYGGADSIEDKIDKAFPPAGLVKVPFGRAAALAQEGALLPLNSFLSSEEIKEFTNTYLLTSLGKFGGAYYYVPRRYETRIMVYCRSKAASAVAQWQEQKDSIDAALKRVNGAGLPTGYTLEDDPNEWDFFDVFVAGWTWAHTPYDGKTCPRVAHRGRRDFATSLRLVDCVFQCGGDSESVLTMRGDAVADAFAWEAAYAWAGIYNPRMLKEEWGGAEIWRGFEEGEVFLAFMTQLDCFFIHGTGRDGLRGYLKDPNDMGVAVMPRGGSISIGPNGMPAREGQRSITTGGWWWGIPRTAPNPRVSYELARYISSAANQIQECSRFGMIPVRRDILSQISLMFGADWVTDVYETSFRQLVHNGPTTIPPHARFDRISMLYLDAWFDIVVGGNWSADRSAPDCAYIKEALTLRYVPQTLGMLGDG